MDDTHSRLGITLRELQHNEAQKTLIRFGGVARGFLSVTCFLLRPRADGDGVFTVMRIGCAMRNANGQWEWPNIPASHAASPAGDSSVTGR
jgi:hypothetical protein